MKLDEIIQPQQLDEISLKQALAAGIIGSAALSPRTLTQLPPPAISTIQQPVAQQQVDPAKQALVQLVAKKYNINAELAQEVIDAAYKYEYQDFPTAKDILAVVGVESSFNPTAKSRLKKDPARGLMQVRANVWGIDPDELHDVESNIQHGAKILHYYYKKFKRNKEAAIQAYNVGETEFRRGTGNPEYLSKVSQERNIYDPARKI